eukprot:272622-Chlamydomonas_euryale.AAC.12
MYPALVAPPSTASAEQAELLGSPLKSLTVCPPMSILPSGSWNEPMTRSCWRDAASGCCCCSNCCCSTRSSSALTVWLAQRPDVRTLSRTRAHMLGDSSSTANRPSSSSWATRHVNAAAHSLLGECPRRARPQACRHTWRVLHSGRRAAHAASRTANQAGQTPPGPGTAPPVCTARPSGESAVWCVGDVRPRSLATPHAMSLTSWPLAWLSPCSMHDSTSSRRRGPGCILIDDHASSAAASWRGRGGGRRPPHDAAARAHT